MSASRLGPLQSSGPARAPRRGFPELAQKTLPSSRPLSPDRSFSHAGRHIRTDSEPKFPTSIRKTVRDYVGAVSWAPSFCLAPPPPSVLFPHEIPASSREAAPSEEALPGAAAWVAHVLQRPAVHYGVAASTSARRRPNDRGGCPVSVQSGGRRQGARLNPSGCEGD